ncbi:MAG TPA: gamma carbonic anhydrase family protein [Actinomycetes bacterium]|jgi:carbonic anhydrase/acetyltransferase-like protein (isoleucine patch superfamily)|nr:gamma carbonic anhydrase family protein [Actinomycetes bacterium]
MLIEHRGQRPRVAPTAYVAPTAVVCGDVTIREDVRVLFGAVITAEGGPVEVGAGSIIMEQAVVRGRDGHPVRIGRHVLVGPHAHVNGAIVEDAAFLATGCSLFPGARVGAGAEIRVNGVVHVNTLIPAEGLVPIGWVAVGDPAEVLPPDQHERIWGIQQALDFPGTVYGVESDRAETMMSSITRGYVELFGHHRDDRILDDS